MKAARAAYIAGVGATSNVLAGMVYGIPVAGTMAHSYIATHDSELDAFRAFATQYPDSILLVDTYDTIEGVRNVIRLAKDAGFDGIELNYDLDNDLSPHHGPRDYEKIRKLADKIGIQISGVCSFLFYFNQKFLGI